MDAAAYQQQLADLMPTGSAWNLEQDSNTMKALKVIASELAYIDGRAGSVLTEALPSTTNELLPEWESAAGLPDSCSPLADTLQERRTALVEKVTRKGGQSKAYFTALAARMGYEIEISEHRPFMCGLSRCGERLSEDHDVRFVWVVTVKQAKLLYLRCGESTLDERLLDFRTADDLACILHKLKPAHTELIIAYEGV